MPCNQKQNNIMQLTLDFNNTKINIWKTIVSKMTTEEIEMRSLLVSMSEPSEENNIFQKLLIEEYKNRK